MILLLFDTKLFPIISKEKNHIFIQSYNDHTHLGLPYMYIDNNEYMYIATHKLQTNSTKPLMSIKTWKISDLLINKETLL